MTTTEQVYEIIREQIGCKTALTPETRIVADLGIDSLDAIELTMELEEEFDIMIDDEVFFGGTDKTIGELVAYIEKRVKDAG